MTQAQSQSAEDAIAAYKRKAGCEASKRWQAKNMEHVKAYRKAYYQAHREELIEYAREYRQKKAGTAEAARQKEAAKNEGLHTGGAGRDGGV